MAAPSEGSGPFRGAGGRLWLRQDEVLGSTSGRLWVPVQSGEGRADRLQGLALSPTPGMARWVDTLEFLGRSGSSSPALRLLDRLDDGGAVVERWQEHLEGWWLRAMHEPDGLRLLCLAMADACRRVGDWHRCTAEAPERASPAPRIRPRTLVRGASGRWLLSEFGDTPEELPGASSDGQSTEIFTLSSHFLAPEEIFLARCDHPLASLCWSIGETFLSLLKLRTLRLSSAGIELPAAGTESPHLGSHRAALVEDLWKRKPGLFADRPLDARQFLYPERLPDRDRRIVAEAVAGVIGGGQQLAEARLETEILRLLDSALAIEPTRRYLDPLVLAGDFEGLARTFQQARQEVMERRSRVPVAPAAPLLEEPTAEAPSVRADAVDELVDPPTEEVVDTRGDLDGPPETPASAPVGAPQAPGPRPTTAPARSEPRAARLPLWATALIAGLTASQLLSLVVIGLLLARTGPVGERAAPETLAAPAAQVAPLAGLGGLAAPAEIAPMQPPPAPEEREPPDTPATEAALEPEPAAPTSTPPAAPRAADGSSDDAPAAGDRVAPAGRVDQAPVASSARSEARSAAGPSPAPAERAGPTRAATPSGGGPPSGGVSAGEAEAGIEGDPRARVSVAGGLNLRLVGSHGSFGPGLVPSGDFQVQLQEGESWTDAGTVRLAAGEQVRIRCGFGRCRKE